MIPNRARAEYRRIAAVSKEGGAPQRGVARVTEGIATPLEISPVDHAIKHPVQNVMERRGRRRYPVRMTVRFRGVGKARRLYSGLYSVGCTADLSPTGLFVLTGNKHSLSLQTKLELSVDWPVRLNGKIPLQLVAQGRVVRVERVGFAVSIDRHEFRTMKRSPEAGLVEPGESFPGFAVDGERDCAISA